MAIYLSNRDGNGKTSEEGHYRLQTRMLKGGVLFSSDLKVTQSSTPNLSVIVNTGDFKIDSSGGYAYTGWISMPETVQISTPDSINPRITTIVIYVDKNAPTSPTPPNNPGIVKLMAINGLPAGAPIAPLDSEIQSAVGSGNPFMRLANITVGKGVNQILNANITDLRVEIGINDDVLISSSILNIVYPVGSIYFNYTSSVNPSILLGFGTWVPFGEGRTIIGVGTSDSAFPASTTGGESNVTLTAAQIPPHSHQIRVKNDDFNWTSGSAGNGPTFTDARDGVNTFNNFSGIVLNNTGGGGAHNNLPPYVTLYMWRRTA